MKIMKPIILVMVLLPFSLMGQISENFDDGNLSTHPTWYGTTEQFIVNTQNQLQLYDSVAGTAWLSTDDAVSGANEWQFWIKLRFAPSSGNYARIYLLSDQQKLDQPLHGYFLQLGEKRSADALELFRQDGEQTTSICRGQDSLIASSFTLRVKVIRDGSGNWQILSDPSGGANFQPQANGSDNTYPQGNYFGMYCVYTKSNARKFYLDDIYSGPVLRDSIPPEILSVTVKNEYTIAVLFNEVLSKTVAENTEYYTLSPDGNQPEKAELQSDGCTVFLEFHEALQNKTHYRLKVNSLRDLAGNVMTTEDVPFDYFLPSAYDVVINEVMADPTPAQGLPEAEYLELYNTTDFDVDLTGWELLIGTRNRLLGPVSINAHGYLILTTEKNAPMFTSYGPVYGFSSLSLLNSGQNLILKDTHGITMSQINYQDNWYGDTDKDNGGWSLEQRNPENSCSGAENWTASINSSGGTPGSINSVFDTVMLFPEPEYIQVKDERNLTVFFNQRMSQLSLQNRSSWFAESHPDTVFVSEDSLQKVSLFFAHPFDNERKYSLDISGNMKNCRGIPMKADTSLLFGIPEQVNSKDVLFNEILFRPKADGAEYVEVVNHSDKIIDLGALSLGIVKEHSDGSVDTVYYPVLSRQQLVFPHEYYVLTKDPEKVKSQYFTRNPEHFITMNSVPVLKNEFGALVLKNTNNEIIDYFAYNENMQYSLLKRTDGVALERYDLDKETNDKNNWHSASADYGFGTPADENSQFFVSDEMKTVFDLEPKIFSPDADGKDDVLKIKYHLEKPGYKVQINIFNASGALIRHLYNESLGTSGTLIWNGKSDNNTKVLPGIYILYIRLTNTDGSLQQFKKPVVVARK